MQLGRSKPHRGFAYVWTLLLVALFGAVSAIVWRAEAVLSKRSREADLLWTGIQFSNAIRDYYQDNQGKQERYPLRLEELLEAPSRILTKRYLRRIYFDPISGTRRWGVLRNAGGGITGVYSMAPGTPLKRHGFPAGYEAFGKAVSYQDWKFSFDPAQVGMPAAAFPPAGASANSLNAPSSFSR